jgi:hypothetical protein
MLYPRTRRAFSGVGVRFRVCVGVRDFVGVIVRVRIRIELVLFTQIEIELV